VTTRYATEKKKGEICDLDLEKKGKIFSKSIESVLSFGNFSKKEKYSLVLIRMPSRIRAKKYLSIQPGMKLRKPSILVVN
jgi:hypothetical protein